MSARAVPRDREPAAVRPLGPEVRKLLVVCPSWVGDVVMATSVLDAVRGSLPGAAVTALLRPGLDELLDGGGWLDDTIVTANRGPLAPLTVSRRIRACRFDAALLLPNSFRSALTVRLAGVPRRYGYDRDGRRMLLTNPVGVLDAGPVSTVAYYRQLGAAALGLARIDRAPRLVVTDAQRVEAQRLLAGIGRPLAVLNPGANREAKRWPIERFAVVADDLARRRGMVVAVTGGPGEAELVRAVIAAAESEPIDLVERGVRLGSLKGVLARADVLITNDTGPRHIAAALDTPVVSLFGPTDHRWTTLEHAREHVLLADPFLPEHLVADQVARHCRVDRINVADVLAAIDRLLGAPRG